LGFWALGFWGGTAGRVPADPGAAVLVPFCRLVDYADGVRDLLPEWVNTPATSA
jgi:hypothetical protein